METSLWTSAGKGNMGNHGVVQAYRGAYASTFTTSMTCFLNKTVVQKVLKKCKTISLGFCNVGQTRRGNPKTSPWPSSLAVRMSDTGFPRSVLWLICSTMCEIKRTSINVILMTGLFGFRINEQWSYFKQKQRLCVSVWLLFKLGLKRFLK